MGEGTLSNRKCLNWFAKCRSSNLSFEDKKSLGRPVEVDYKYLY